MADDAGLGADGAGHAAVLAAARSGEPDRYLAALLAPGPARPALLALAGFLGELQRVAALVREPAMGTIRLSWWREAMEQPAGTRTGNPIADAMREVARVRALPPELIGAPIDARTRALDARAIPDAAALDAFLWQSEGVPFVLAALLLGAPLESQLEAAAALGARAYGLPRLLLSLPHALSRGRLPLPLTTLAAIGADPARLLAGGGGEQIAPLCVELCAEARRHLAACRQQLAKVPHRARPAFLPLALVTPYVRALERVGRDPIRQVDDIGPLTRISRLAAARWLGRL